MSECEINQVTSVPEIWWPCVSMRPQLCVYRRGDGTRRHSFEMRQGERNNWIISDLRVTVALMGSSPAMHKAEGAAGVLKTAFTFHHPFRAHHWCCWEIVIRKSGNRWATWSSICSHVSGHLVNTSPVFTAKQLVRELVRLVGSLNDRPCSPACC